MSKVMLAHLAPLSFFIIPTFNREAQPIHFENPFSHDCSSQSPNFLYRPALFRQYLLLSPNKPLHATNTLQVHILTRLRKPYQLSSKYLCVSKCGYTCVKSRGLIYLKHIHLTRIWGSLSCGR